MVGHEAKYGTWAGKHKTSTPQPKAVHKLVIYDL